jgi:phenylacetic acid degradation protein
MNAVIMDDAVIGAESIIGALTFVPGEMVIPPRSIAVGNPAKVVKQVSDEMLAWKTKGTALYQSLPADMHAHCFACEPLTEIEPNRPNQEILFDTWKTINSE